MIRAREEKHTGDERRQRGRPAVAGWVERRRRQPCAAAANITRGATGRTTLHDGVTRRELHAPRPTGQRRSRPVVWQAWVSRDGGGGERVAGSGLGRAELPGASQPRRRRPASGQASQPNLQLAGGLEGGRGRGRGEVEEEEDEGGARSRAPNKQLAAAERERLSGGRRPQARLPPLGAACVRVCARCRRRCMTAACSSWPWPPLDRDLALDLDAAAAAALPVLCSALLSPADVGRPGLT